MTATRITVGGPAPYDVVVGRGLLAEIDPLLGDAGRVVIIHPRRLAERASDAAKAIDGRTVELVAVPDGEVAKELAVLSEVWDSLGAAGISRGDAIVGLGGGAATDLAGFAAATWLRGVRVVHVPTTLLGMVDAAVGGKTAINTRVGKNLVGAFHPPAGVLCDLDFLATLPPEEYVSGLAEVIKAGFIADPSILDLVEADPGGATRHDGAHTRELVERSIQVKARVVSDDLYEHGGREVLNYGHTLGHAVEKVENFRCRHGAAVSIGLVYAAALSRATRGLDDATVGRHRDVLTSVGLPTAYDAKAWPRLHDAMRYDKKSRGGRLRFVVLDGLAKPTLLDDPDPAVLESAYAEVAS